MNAYNNIQHLWVFTVVQSIGASICSSAISVPCCLQVIITQEKETRSVLLATLLWISKKLSVWGNQSGYNHKHFSSSFKVSFRFLHLCHRHSWYWHDPCSLGFSHRVSNPNNTAGEVWPNDVSTFTILSIGRQGYYFPLGKVSAPCWIDGCLQWFWVWAMT